jgi:hypothetical protein
MKYVSPTPRYEEARLSEDDCAVDDLCRKLELAIAEHHRQKADDRCIFDDDKLYAAAGLPPCDRRVGSKEQMLANCARFIERRCESGSWKSYVELERELGEAKEQLEHATNPVHSCGENCQRPACVFRRERDQWRKLAESLHAIVRGRFSSQAEVDAAFAKFSELSKG